MRRLVTILLQSVLASTERYKIQHEHNLNSLVVYYWTVCMHTLSSMHREKQEHVGKK